MNAIIFLLYIWYGSKVLIFTFQQYQTATENLTDEAPPLYTSHNVQHVTPAMRLLCLTLTDYGHPENQHGEQKSRGSEKRKHLPPSPDCESNHFKTFAA